MLKRKIMADLHKWKEEYSNSKALCIIGARQTGKSTIAREFGKENYGQVIELNFLSRPEYRQVFSKADPESIYIALTAITGKEIITGSTLLILDEIQECPEARTAVKFLVEDHRLDIIETGSLLGVNVKEVSSYPVGFEMIIHMYPMTFEEFIWAIDLPDQTIKYLEDCFLTNTPVLEAVHNQMLTLFYTYMVVGGMPEAVQTYANTSDLAAVFRIHRSILDLYRADIIKYASLRDHILILKIFDDIPGQLSAKNKRFKISRIDSNARVFRYENSFLWLEAAGIALPCYNVSAPVYPLRLNEKRSLFKLYFLDTGLLCTMISNNLGASILKGELQVNEGAIVENVFAQELKSRGLNLFYFDSKRNYELDFLVEQPAGIQVLEIKSGKYYQMHASLDKALANDEWKLNDAVVFCKGNVDENDKILYLPLYMIMFYQVKEDTPEIWKPDMSALQNIPF